MKSVVGELCAVLDEKELDRPETPVSIHSSNIVLENVSFSYESEKPLLKNINLSIPENSITAFVGQWRQQVYHYEADCGILGCNKRNCQVRRNRYSQNSVVTAYG